MCVCVCVCFCFPALSIKDCCEVTEQSKTSSPCKRFLLLTVWVCYQSLLALRNISQFLFVVHLYSLYAKRKKNTFSSHCMLFEKHQEQYKSYSSSDFLPLTTQTNEWSSSDCIGGQQSCYCYREELVSIHILALSSLRHGKAIVCVNMDSKSL